MKKSLLGEVILALLVIAFSSTSHGDPSSTAAVPPEGTGMGNGQNLHGHRGMGRTQAPPPTGPQRPAPFQLTHPGPAPWPYDALTSAEKAQVDRNRDTRRWDDINAAYASAIGERSSLAAAESAALQLGLGSVDLGQQGVVP